MNERTYPQAGAGRTTQSHLDGWVSVGVGVGGRMRGTALQAEFRR